MSNTWARNLGAKLFEVKLEGQRFKVLMQLWVVFIIPATESRRVIGAEPKNLEANGDVSTLLLGLGTKAGEYIVFLGVGQYLLTVTKWVHIPHPGCSLQSAIILLITTERVRRSCRSDLVEEPLDKGLGKAVPGTDVPGGSGDDFKGQCSRRSVQPHPIHNLPTDGSHCH